MRIPKSNSRTKVLVVLVASVGLIYGSAGPAAATTAITGAGTGGGYEEGDFTRGHGGPGKDPECNTPQEGQYGHSRFVLTHASTYEGAQDNPLAVASATGVTEMDIVTDHHYAAPQGVSEDCPGDVAPGVDGVLVPGFVTIERATIDTIIPVVGDVHCAGGGQNQDIGEYTRIGTTIAMTFTVQCTLTLGPLGSVPQQTVSGEVTHYLEGQMVPCGFDEDPIFGMPVPTCEELDPAFGSTSQASSLVVSTFQAEGTAAP